MMGVSDAGDWTLSEPGMAADFHGVGRVIGRIGRIGRIGLMKSCQANCEWMGGEMKGLTDRKLRLLGFVHSYRRRRGYPPSLREMQAQMEVTTIAAVQCYLMALERKGMIGRVRRNQRLGIVARSVTVTARGLRYVTLPEGVEYFTLREVPFVVVWDRV